MAMRRDLLLLAVTSQACALAAIVWLPARAGLYVQIVPAVVLLAAIGIRFRSGRREYDRLEARSRARRAELQRLLERNSQ